MCAVVLLKHVSVRCALAWLKSARHWPTHRKHGLSCSTGHALGLGVPGLLGASHGQHVQQVVQHRRGCVRRHLQQPIVVELHAKCESRVTAMTTPVDFASTCERHRRSDSERQGRQKAGSHADSVTTQATILCMQLISRTLASAYTSSCFTFCELVGLITSRSASCMYTSTQAVADCRQQQRMYRQQA